MQLGAPEIAILEWLAGHGRATALEIGSACGIAESSTRGRLIILQQHKLVSKQMPNAASPTKTYAITGEGRRRVKAQEV